MKKSELISYHNDIVSAISSSVSRVWDIKMAIKKGHGNAGLAKSIIKKYGHLSYSMKICEDTNIIIRDIRSMARTELKILQEWVNFEDELGTALWENDKQNSCKVYLVHSDLVGLEWGENAPVFVVLTPAELDEYAPWKMGRDYSGLATWQEYLDSMFTITNIEDYEKLKALLGKKPEDPDRMAMGLYLRYQEEEAKSSI
jgi:hypothetical protein